MYWKQRRTVLPHHLKVRCVTVINVSAAKRGRRTCVHGLVRLQPDGRLFPQCCLRHTVLPRYTTSSLDAAIMKEVYTHSRESNADDVRDAEPDEADNARCVLCYLSEERWNASGQLSAMKVALLGVCQSCVTRWVGEGAGRTSIVGRATRFVSPMLNSVGSRASSRGMSLRDVRPVW